MDPDGPSITRVLQGSAATPEVVEQVLPLVYDQLRRLAAHFLKSERDDHTLMTTELVHEAYLRLLGLEQITFQGRRHFFSTAAVAMRRILVDHARRRAAAKRIPADAQVPIDLAGEPASDGDFDVLALDGALGKLAAASPRQAKVVELRYFAGLTEPQIAEVLELSRATVARDLRSAKLWLRREMRG